MITISSFNRALLAIAIAASPLSCKSVSKDSQLHDSFQTITVPAAFHNPIVAGGADPWVIFKDGYYYYCTADGVSSVFVAKTKNLLDIGKVPANRVWTGSPGTPYAIGAWAAELHYLDGRWYIYYAASPKDNADHRMFVLESKTDDPTGEYVMKGKISALTDRWAIDGTVLVNDKNEKFFVWSGWDDFIDYQQNLYIAPMENPWTLKKSDLPTIRIEAENAKYVKAKVRNAKRASNGRTLGKIDYEDSSVTFSFKTLRAGDYQVDIRYTNGTGSVSTQTLTANDGSAQTISYPSVGWENFQSVHAFVRLNEGANTIRINKGQSYAEIDRIDIVPKGGDRIVLSMPEFDYEKQGGPAFVNEGPQVLQKGGKTHIIYSASGSWTDDYKLVHLSFEGGDILDRNNWVKRGPVFSKTEHVFGPGHASFTSSPDGQQSWIVYHAAKFKGSKWDRNVRTQQFSWDKDNNPVFGWPIEVTAPLPPPSGP